MSAICLVDEGPAKLGASMFVALEIDDTFGGMTTALGEADDGTFAYVEETSTRRGHVFAPIGVDLFVKENARHTKHGEVPHIESLVARVRAAVVSDRSLISDLDR